jgi:hypothetical protein
VKGVWAREGGRRVSERALNSPGEITSTSKATKEQSLFAFGRMGWGLKKEIYIYKKIGRWGEGRDFCALL